MDGGPVVTTCISDCPDKFMPLHRWPNLFLEQELVTAFWTIGFCVSASHRSGTKVFAFSISLTQTYIWRIAASPPRPPAETAAATCGVIPRITCLHISTGFAALPEYLCLAPSRTTSALAAKLCHATASKLGILTGSSSLSLGQLSVPRIAAGVFAPVPSGLDFGVSF